MSDNTHRFPASDDTTPLPPYDGGGRSDTEVLPPYDASYGSAGPTTATAVPLGPSTPGSVPPDGRDSAGASSPRPRRRTAGLLVGALVLGVGGGVLGAAGYDALNDDPTATAAPEPAATAASSRSPLGTSPDSEGSGETDSTGSEARRRLRGGGGPEPCCPPW